ncbi:MAG TPA: type II toxin-antitoxin system RelE/ParE family toxin [Planctomycetota bacterium]|jgi:phage-related protein|nr:type II toxin-antitoxin system RelE/ParE family toxin [Planctomycetota bacterium]
MPITRVLFYQDADGRSPVVEWLEELRTMDQVAFAKCAAVIERLEEAGHELRRPTADLLRDGVYELRARKGRVNYRLLYFFHGRNVAIVAHGLTKEAAVPRADIDRALARKRAFEADPERHTYRE